ncbi:autotransporter outer membrane beta-barrel domain-containing protein [Luteibacter sp. UNC138MFCol5.1]|uniref:autotransporter family protein n=1 Tax=Luteibacter sp. UNC138MFCol5.1 TaxID=1502774 RepID=UPI0015A52102|nr:autotransporter outer membrane beta-barrel domain-containing protein [Luteibacter sp. UNC138MFCol5.1]
MALEFADGAQGTLNGANVESTGAAGLIIVNRTSASVMRISATGGSIKGFTYGTSVASAATLDLNGVAVSGTGADLGAGVGVFDGTLNATASQMTGALNGAYLMYDPRSSPGATGINLNLDSSSMQSATGSGIWIDAFDNATTTDARISLTNGSVLVGGNGTAIEAASGTTASVTVDRSAVDGDVLVAAGGRVDLALGNQATLHGRMSGPVAASLASGSVWNIEADSDVDSLGLSGGAAIFDGSGDSSRKSLVIRGGLTGTGGTLGLNTELGAGGPLSQQVTDRVLIEGDVATTGVTELAVTGSGSGALTDANQNGVVDANEGISLVQVHGASRADAFALRGGYVAAGPWQYTLHAFGPGQVDQAQNALQNGATLGWDYRLGNSYVCEHDCDPVEPPIDPPVDPGVPPVDPPVEPPVDPGPGEGERLEVVPQLPSYLSAPAALLTYGDMLNDGLHQRLGELRSGTSSDPVGGEVFARYLGGQLRYTSNLSFTRFGYDFDQQVNALQLGGSVIALDGDNGSLRAGWAADHGTTRVTPKAVDGDSSAKYRANGMSAWITWLHGSGLWVDGVVGSTRFRGDVGTDARGADVGRIRANGWTMSVEAGMPLAIGGDWTVEPRFQLKHQQLNFRNFTDVDGLLVRLGTAKQTSARIGAQVARTTNVRFMPYASLDLTHTSNGDPAADVSNAEWNVAERFGSGRVGNAYRFAAGAVSQLTDHVQVYGQGTYQHFVGSYGMRGWSGNLGVRVVF